MICHLIYTHYNRVVYKAASYWSTVVIYSLSYNVREARGKKQTSVLLGLLGLLRTSLYFCVLLCTSQYFFVLLSSSIYLDIYVYDLAA